MGVIFVKQRTAQSLTCNVFLLFSFSLFASPAFAASPGIPEEIIVVGLAAVLGAAIGGVSASFFDTKKDFSRAALVATMMMGGFILGAGLSVLAYVIGSPIARMWNDARDERKAKAFMEMPLVISACAGDVSGVHKYLTKAVIQDKNVSLEQIVNTCVFQAPPPFTKLNFSAPEPIPAASQKRPEQVAATPPSPFPAPPKNIEVLAPLMTAAWERHFSLMGYVYDKSEYCRLLQQFHTRHDTHVLRELNTNRLRVDCDRGLRAWWWGLNANEAEPKLRELVWMWLNALKDMGVDFRERGCIENTSCIYPRSSLDMVMDSADLRFIRFFLLAGIDPTVPGGNTLPQRSAFELWNARKALPYSATDRRSLRPLPISVVNKIAPSGSIDISSTTASQEQATQAMLADIDQYLGEEHRLSAEAEVVENEAVITRCRRTQVAVRQGAFVSILPPSCQSVLKPPE